MNPSPQFLNGLKVIELASVLAGPSVGMFLAELGAKVIKIENSRHGGDPTRGWKTASESQTAKISAYYASTNWGKEVLQLDLKIRADYQRIIALIAEADILLMNFKPGDESRYQLDYDSLKKINPKLIVGHIIGFPFDDRPAFDIVVQAESGLMSLNGDKAGPIMKWPLPIVDILAAHQLKEGILLALINRQVTGLGGYVTVSLFDAAIASLFNVGTNVLMGKADPRGLGPLHPNIAPYGETLLTADNQLLVLAVGTDAQFRALCDALGTPESFIRDFSTNQMRVANRISLAHQLQDLAAQKSFDELHKDLILGKVPFGRVKTVKTVLDQLPRAYFLAEQTGEENTVRTRTAIFTFRS